MMRLKHLAMGLALATIGLSTLTAAAATQAKRQRVIVMVWDGLRADSVNPVDTPNLYAMQRAGVQFTDNHATYPTFTMMNASSFATGSFPKTSGFYGNTFWTPPQTGAAVRPVGKSADASAVSYVDPVFTEDYAILTTLNDYYNGQLLLVKTMFEVAQRAGLKTATIGKSGPAYLQDLSRQGYFLDENAVLPKSLAKELQAAHIALPFNSSKAFGADELSLAEANGKPTAKANPIMFALPNGVLARDGSDSSQGASEDAANQYMLKVFTDYLLPRKHPDLSLIWFRTPDNSEHAYGPGSPNYHKALASQDRRLGELQQALKAQHLSASTNIIVVSDHAHSNVSGATDLYPLRAIQAGTSINNGVSNASLGPVDPVQGFSVSGDVRSADLLTFAGFKAYDGSGCLTSAMSGIKADGNSVQPVSVDSSGALCGKAGTKYQAISANLPTPVASFKVPEVLPSGAIVVAANGGSDYFYVPDHDAQTVQQLVRFLQSREEYGAVFVDSRYGPLPGTLPLAMVNLENAQRQAKGQPDVVVSFQWDAQQLVHGMPGIEYASFGGNRGMHGSFSPIDVHNVLVGFGPGFKSGVAVINPTGNVDVAPTVAHLLGQSLPQADGRVLNEALRHPAGSAPSEVVSRVINPVAPAQQLRFQVPTDLTGASLDASRPLGIYSIQLMVKDLTMSGKTYRYFDYGQATRN